eukprot:6193827-Pleurochrysis_carterae.AAC.2
MQWDRKTPIATCTDRALYTFSSSSARACGCPKPLAGPRACRLQTTHLLMEQPAVQYVSQTMRRAERRERGQVGGRARQEAGTG